MNHEKYSQEDWDNFVRDYEKVDSILDLYEYTPEQYEKIGKMKGRCAAYAAKEYGKRFGRELENKVNEFQGFMEGLLDELNH